jgi:transposase-like protein
LSGRLKALTASKQKRAVELYQEKRLAVKEICKMMGISKPTLYAYVWQAQSSP